MKHILILAIFLICFIASAGEPAVLETDSFSVKLPEGWEIVDLSRGALVSGPHEEQLRFSSTKVNGYGNELERKELVKEVESNLLESMRLSASDPALESSPEASTVSLANGGTAHILKTHTRDKSVYFFQYGMLHKDTVILVTLQGNSQHNAASIEAALLLIMWSGA